MKKPIIARGFGYSDIQVIGKVSKGNEPYLRFQAGESKNSGYYFGYVENPKQLRRLAHAILKALGDE